jgi:DNA-binding MarR family transcriptional regulator
MPKWRHDSEFGIGSRVPLCREQRAQFKARLTLARRPGRLTLAAEKIGLVLLHMLGLDGQLDPSVATIAARAAVDPSTVTRSLVRLRELGFLRWTRRLVRDAASHWRVEQTSNAYELTVPAAMCILPEKPCTFVLSSRLRRKARTWAGGSIEQQDATSYENAARQLQLLRDDLTDVKQARGYPGGAGG